jgi:hypothetical protein
MADDAMATAGLTTRKSKMLYIETVSLNYCDEPIDVDRGDNTYSAAGLDDSRIATKRYIIAKK